MPVKLKEREYRNFRVEALEGEDEKRTVTGYATTFGNSYTLYSDDEYEIREVIDAAALDGADLSDVIMQYNHEGRVFARTSNGTLEVAVDPHGLHITANLDGTDLGRDVYEEIRGGYTDKMSIGMKVSNDEWQTELIDGKTVETRTIKGISKIYDVSAVSIPANDATEISIRSLADGVIDRLAAERLKEMRLEAVRKLTQLRTKIGG